MHLQPELDFLKLYLSPPKLLFRSAIWLLSDFDDPIWIYNFDFKESKSISWAIKLPNGSLLTSAENSKLLMGLKHFLICSTRVSGDYFSETNCLNGQQRSKFIIACQIIDTLLLNADKYRIQDFGLAALTAGDLKEILNKIASSPVAAEAVYDWSIRLTDYCVTLRRNTADGVIENILKLNPELSIITTEQQDEDLLNIPASEIPALRAALMHKGLYIRHARWGWSPHTTKISNEIYPNCIWGRENPKPTPCILCFDDEIKYSREFAGVKTTTGDPSVMTHYDYQKVRQTLYHLGVLHELDLPAPSIEALVQANNHEIESRSVGRHRSLPSTLVFAQLRNAIELHLRNGETIINGFCEFIIHCKNHNIEPSSLTDIEFQQLISRELLDLGVRRYGLSLRQIGSASKACKSSKNEYFGALRSNAGLLELVRIYIGATQLVTGILTARRVSELINLSPRKCLNEDEQLLIFYNAKSTKGLFGIRSRKARPIEPAAINMIKLLIQMNKKLTEAHIIASDLHLFASPHMRGYLQFVDSDKTTFNKNIDLFCDYFETPINEEGLRHYIRQHQLRRFFAMLFFYSKSFGMLDTLRWMLGHNDPVHVWRYIVESVDGAVLSSAKAQYVAEALHSGDTENFKELAEVIKQRYGTNDFVILSTEEIEDYILDLLSNGYIEIEPDFFKDNNGNTFKVVARVIKHYE